MNFAEKLKKARKQKNLTQVELCNEIKVSKGVIGDIERGARKPSKDLAVKLANFFNTDALYWLNEEEEIEKEENNHTEYKVLKETVNRLIAENLITDLNLNDEVKNIIIDAVKIEIYIKLKNKNKKEQD